MTLHGSVGEALAALGACGPRGSSAWGDRVLLDVAPPGTPSLLAAKLEPIGPERPLLLAVGSERGWTANERALFAEARFTVASLGTRILRTETAVTAALALALAKAGYLEG